VFFGRIGPSLAQVCAISAALLLGCGVASEATRAMPPSRGGVDRVGVLAPDLALARWAIEPPSPLDGKVRVVRFWTDTCPFCRASAPALRELDAAYRDRGVAVVGIYHPKPRGAASSRAGVRRFADAHGWRFGVAIDDDWSLLDAFWLASGDRDYTSVTFVLDRDGIVRFVHPGPEFHRAGPADHAQCRADYDDLVAAVESLLP
jgi:peroxiredoxin